MDGVRGLHPPLVSGVAGIVGKLLGVSTVHLAERTDDGIPCSKTAVLQRLKQAATNDLKPFLGTGGTPRGFEPTEGILEAHQRLLATFTADFNV